MVEYIEREVLYKTLETWRDAHADVDDEYGCGLLEDVLCEVDAQTAVSIPQWISAKDKLPEPDENPVLAGNAELGVVNMAWYHRGKRIWETPSGFSCSFTHWMPLPAPPKGDADNG